MVQTVDFKEMVKESANNRPELREALFGEVIELLLKNDVKVAKQILSDYVAETASFKELSKNTDMPVTDIKRILSVEENPTINEFFFVIKNLQEIMKVSFDITPTK
ncbi:MAG: hypothetical protein K0U39_08355 [Alphaproteobacteria bacterium]|nr:hypothetical protein [Alphaproteobacteria bacterium]